ncbi:hypothetical protein [Streptomyces sp. NRRL S-1448]|uniref:hypothetical protein n=1 Tax=Streptomyces sp. NRRL S-1448 TaxID=1463883 RepID=UPI00131B6074|nr:hypothetical protein [Streptomyces sp. NRRL S-1448]
MNFAKKIPRSIFLRLNVNLRSVEMEHAVLTCHETCDIGGLDGAPKGATDASRSAGLQQRLAGVRLGS